MKIYYINVKVKVNVSNEKYLNIPQCRGLIFYKNQQRETTHVILLFISVLMIPLYRMFHDHFNELLDNRK